tara:strand:- start:510 stop:851 length:342 start_codon:yes stop_codon:yes gene_type:complete
MDKQFKSITEVSEQLNIKQHVIRYWDSKFEGISTRLSGTKRRFFSNENINKIKELKKILYQNGKQNYSLDLAKKIFNKKSPKKLDNNNLHNNNKNLDIAALQEISDNLKKLLT